ncbi:MAG TPA: glycosyltransferase family 2 protein [Acidimicrobiales bacterium]|nr:glycosyltransferase family 2 protein [Acidimicrobiales bacterium]
MTARVGDDRQDQRVKELQRLAVDQGHRDFLLRHHDLKLTPVVALVCAYEEEGNIGDVLAAVPAEACGLAVTPLVVVDGGADATGDEAIAAGAITFVLPVNLGHGMALRVGYDLCLSGGAQYVVTLDADGQNDPSEIPVMLRPLVDDAADFVVASRRLGVDNTTDWYRRAGVKFFAWLMNLLNGTRLTDTSNGFRALRASMLADVTGRLVQDQYQTAELLTTAVRRGWRVTERPTVWHERASGRSKKGANWRYGFRYAQVLLSTWLRER